MIRSLDHPFGGLMKELLVQLQIIFYLKPPKRNLKKVYIYYSNTPQGSH